MKEDNLPDWTKEETQEKWSIRKQKNRTCKNCSKCGRRLIIVLCRYNEEKYYCFNCCPDHKWQSDYDWSLECARCGMSYTTYLESLLQKHKIPFKKFAK